MEHTHQVSVIVPGDAAKWHVFRDADVAPGGGGLLAAFRSFLAGMDPRHDGVLRIGGTAVTTHLADVVRAMQIPSVFAASVPGAELAGMTQALVKRTRRDRLRALVDVAGLRMDERGNVRQGRFSYLDRWEGALGWVEWKAGTRLCLGEFRVELLDTARAGLHLRTGVRDEASPVDASGYRTGAPRFLSSAKPMHDGVYAIVPCDPVEPLRALDGHGRTGDEEEDALLSFALQAFYGAPADVGLLLRQATVHSTFEPLPCRAA